MAFLPATDRSDAAAALLRATFGRTPAAVGRAPGRVNLIGEHTDYNHGLCLPIPLPHATYAACAVRDDDLVAVVSAQEPEPWVGPPGTATGWAGYAAGVVWALREEGVDVPGLDVAVDSSVPVGAGLSSSAALECAVARLVADLVGPLDPELLVRAAIRAETVLVGAPTGGLDQTVALLAPEGQALLLDFSSGSRRQLPWRPEGLSLLVVDTGVRHRHADGEYADRRRSCERACAELGVASLRDVHLADLAGRSGEWLPRARHVVTENDRVSSFVDAVAASDWRTAGALMTASHVSLRDDFEVSCAELDATVTAAIDAGALGARMTGGGFGGSAIALVPGERLDGVTAAVDRAYDDRGWDRPSYLLAG
jgi:galactokinase